MTLVSGDLLLRHVIAGHDYCNGDCEYYYRLKLSSSGPVPAYAEGFVEGFAEIACVGLHLREDR